MIQVNILHVTAFAMARAVFLFGVVLEITYLFYKTITFHEKILKKEKNIFLQNFMEDLVDCLKSLIYQGLCLFCGSKFFLKNFRKSYAEKLLMKKYFILDIETQARHRKNGLWRNKKFSGGGKFYMNIENIEQVTFVGRASKEAKKFDFFMEISFLLSRYIYGGFGIKHKEGVVTSRPEMEILAKHKTSRGDIYIIADFKRLELEIVFCDEYIGEVEDKRYELGKIFITKGISRVLEDNQFAHEVYKAFCNYKHCEWGEIPEDDIKANEDAIEYGLRIIGCYKTSKGDIYIITEADRSCTTILFCDEY